MLNIFTIAFNCADDLRDQWSILRRLRVPFHWSIVEGYAQPVGCTSWCKPLTDRWQKNGGSVDGTRDLLADLARHNPDAVSARLADGPWPGKLAMCNAALASLPTPGTLVEIDADEYWTPEQLEKIPAAIDQFSQCGGLQFGCRLWVTDRHVTYLRPSQAVGYGFMPYEWFRAWRHDGRQRFESHEPPKLERQGRLLHRNITAALGLSFEHRSYVRRDQVALKEEYYGYAGAVAGWERMRASTAPTVRVNDFLPWVQVETFAVAVQ